MLALKSPTNYFALKFHNDVVCFEAWKETSVNPKTFLTDLDGFCWFESPAVSVQNKQCRAPLHISVYKMQGELLGDITGKAEVACKYNLMKTVDA